MTTQTGIISQLHLRSIYSLEWHTWQHFLIERDHKKLKTVNYIPRGRPPLLDLTILGLLAAICWIGWITAISAKLSSGKPKMHISASSGSHLCLISWWKATPLNLTWKLCIRTHRSCNVVKLKFTISIAFKDAFAHTVSNFVSPDWNISDAMSRLKPKADPDWNVKHLNFASGQSSAVEHIVVWRLPSESKF